MADSLIKYVNDICYSDQIDSRIAQATHESKIYIEKFAGGLDHSRMVMIREWPRTYRSFNIILLN